MPTTFSEHLRLDAFHIRAPPVRFMTDGDWIDEMIRAVRDGWMTVEWSQVIPLTLNDGIGCMNARNGHNRNILLENPDSFRNWNIQFPNKSLECYNIRYAVWEYCCLSNAMFSTKWKQFYSSPRKRKSKKCVFCQRLNRYLRGPITAQ